MLAFFIFWLICLPQELKFIVTDASLAQFNFSTANNRTLLYDLAVNVTVQNLNKRVGVYFDGVQVIANNRKKRFAAETLTSATLFYQGRKNTIVLHSVLRGQQVLSLKEHDTKQYNSQKSSEVFSIDVKIALRLRVRFGKIKTGYFKPLKIDCKKQKIPLHSNGTSGSNGTFVSASNFKATRCKSMYILTSEGDGYNESNTTTSTIRFQTTRP